MEIEGVDRMDNEIDERGNLGVDSETEGVDSDNEGVDKEVLPPYIKRYIIRNPPNFKYSDKKCTWWSMGRNNLIVGPNELHSVAKAYANAVNATFSISH